MKHVVIGTDEAGYGPNLGPFVIACTEWELPQNPFNDEHNDLEQLHNLLKTVVASTPGELKKRNRQIVIGDSKKLYSPSKSTETLRKTLFRALAILGHFPKNWPELLEILAAEDATNVLQDYFSETLFSTADDITAEDCFRPTGVLLKTITSRVITPAIFNRAVEKMGNKAHLLTDSTMGLIARQIAENQVGQITVICDKHGGRNHYLDVLDHWFPDDLIEIIIESRAASIYRFGNKERHIEFRFLAKADQMVPTGLASMTAKYLRELAMKIFNTFWTNQLPHLKPTAGYPVDAVRFYSEIEATADKLRIPKETLWRNR